MCSYLYSAYSYKRKYENYTLLISKYSFRQYKDFVPLFLKAFILFDMFVII